MQQHTFGGGSVGEGHRVVEVSKTVTQEHRPMLEREISAAHRARQTLNDHSQAVAGGGLAAVGAGIGVARSGKRKLKQLDANVTRTGGLLSEANSRHQGALADEHGASEARTAAVRAHGSAKSRQAALAQWEQTGTHLPHTTQIRSSTGNQRAYTVPKVPSKQHAVVRNALANEVGHTGAGADKAIAAHHAAVESTRRTYAETKRFGALHETGQTLRRRKAPRLRAKVGAGRGLALAGGITAGAALVAGERKRSQVGKSLTQMKGIL